MTKPIPATEDITLDDENFDLEDWLNGTEYAEKWVEVFRKGNQLAELDELQKYVKSQRAVATDRRAMGMSITDEESDRDQLADKAQAQIDTIIANLKGTGVIYHLRGIAPGEREVIEDTLARSLKPSPPKVEEIDGEQVEVKARELGGRQHSEYMTKLGYELAAKCIIGIIAPGKGKDAEKSVKYDVEYVIENLRYKLGGSEWARLLNAVFDVNFYSYDIDEQVTLDFS